MHFGCNFDPFWTRSGPQVSSKSGQKLIRKITSKKGGSREVRDRRAEAEVGSRRSNYQRGLDIRKVQLFEDSDIRGFGDLVIRIFGNIFGDLDIRRRVLHADPVGRRMTGSAWRSTFRSKRRGPFHQEEEMRMHQDWCAHTPSADSF